MSERTMHAPAAGEDVREPTDAQVNDAYMWYRHDFGLLDDEERERVRFQAREWFRAWGKALSNGDDPAALLHSAAAPMDDEAAMIAQLRAGADTVADGSLDPDDFANLWVQRLSSLIRAALRSGAQGEDDAGEVCHLCGEEFDPSESGTVTGPLGQDDGLPRWYRCPRCARAYDAGYQQGQRDPRGDETADPTALRSEAPGEDCPETDVIVDIHPANWQDGRVVSDAAVRITHVPTGITVICDDQPTLARNKAVAIAGLRAAVRAARRGEGGGDGRE